MSEIQFMTVFDKAVGPTEHYRIPSVVVTESGVTVACCDSRFFTCSDNPNRIEKAVRRSTDSGKSWGEVITAVREHGDRKEASSAAIDPALLYDRDTNRIFMLYCHTPAGVGILNCEKSVGEDENGNLLLHIGKKEFVLRDGAVYDKKGGRTAYTVDENGDAEENGVPCGNIYTDGKIREKNTSYLMLCYSDDDGLSWSKPVSLNRQVKMPFMSFIGPGPGIGVALQKGKHRGRLVFPIYFGTAKWPLMLSCACMYSDDKGKTWKLGVSPNSTRRLHGRRMNIRFLFNSEMLTESQVIEQEDGTLKYFMRNHDKRKRLAVAYSDDGGRTFRDFHWDDTLPQPICQASVLKLQNRDKPYVVLVNPCSETKRENGTVRLSEDDGETFPYARRLCDGEFVYSCIAELPDGSIGVLYEGATTHEKIEFARFPLDWIREVEK